MSLDRDKGLVGSLIANNPSTRERPESTRMSESLLERVCEVPFCVARATANIQYCVKGTRSRSMVGEKGIAECGGMR